MNHPVRSALAAALLVAVLSCSGAAGADAVVRSADLGSPADGDTNADVYLSPAWSFWGNPDSDRFVRYENETGFWWATKAPDPGSCIRSRVLKSFYSGNFHVRPIEPAPKTVYVAFRYKDNLVKPAPVDAVTEGGLKRLGTLGGTLDRAWKTATFSVSSKDLSLTGGRWIFRIGRQDYGELMGDLPIQWVKVSDQPIAAPPDQPGFFPKRQPTPFDDAGKTQVYREGEAPMFPVGVVIKGFRTNTFDVVKSAGLNSMMLLGWEEPLGPMRKVYQSGRWSDRVELGLPNQLDEANRVGVGYLPSFFTDTRSYWIEHQYQSESSAVAAIARSIKNNRNSPGLLAWWLKDEADHDDATWGAPEEFIQQLYVEQKKADPNRPAFVNFQGWKPRQYERYLDAADIVGFDTYPVGRGKTARPIAEFTDRIRTEVAGRRAIWAIVEGHEGVHRKAMGRTLTEDEVVCQGYVAVAHGIQGVFYYIDDESAYIDPSEIPEVWNGIQRFAREVLADGGLSKYLVPPAKTIELSGVDDKVSTGSPALHAALFAAPDGSRVVVVVNDGPDEIRSASVRVEGLADGPVPVLFEDRTVQAAGGRIADPLPGYARRVYLVAPAKGE